MRAPADKNAGIDVLYEGQFIMLARKGDWEFVQRNNCTGIVIVAAMTANNEVIFVEQYRPPVDKMVIEFPAGLVNDLASKPDETLLSAAQRELMEEAGYEAPEWSKILEGPVSSGSSADLVTLYMALKAKQVSDGGGDDMESITVHTVPLNETDRWLRNIESEGRLIEPKIYTGLYFLKSYNKTF